MHDALGGRMKEQYEDRTRYLLPRRTFSIIRLDGKAFHTFTRGFDRPFDKDLMFIMDQTAKALCREIQGAKLAYTQSDEISILVTDFEGEKTCAWFDGNIQKIVSISAAIATATFNREAQYRDVEISSSSFNKFRDKNGCTKTGYFDSRVFTIPDPVEVENYFIWRQNDASRNSIQMAARAMYSHKECDNKNTSQLQEMVFQKGQNWNDYPVGFKRGRCIVKVPKVRTLPSGLTIGRTEWESVEPPIFTQEREFLRSRIPLLTMKSG
jgi:tRNA(His) guanylyltransferase